MRLIKGTQDAKRVPKGLSPSSGQRIIRCPCGRQAHPTGKTGEYKCPCGRVLRASPM